MLLGSQIYNNADGNKILKEIKNINSYDGNVIQLFLRKMCSSSKKDKLIFTEKEIKDIKSYLKK